MIAGPSESRTATVPGPLPALCRRTGHPIPHRSSGGPMATLLWREFRVPFSWYDRAAIVIIEGAQQIGQFHPHWAQLMRETIAKESGVWIETARKTARNSDQ